LIDLRPLPPREPSFLARGTSSSNPASSAGESANHRFLGESEPTQTREKHRLRGSAGVFDRRVSARCQCWTRGCPGDGGLRHIFSALLVQRARGCTHRSRPGFVTVDTGGGPHGPEATMGPVGVREGTAVPGASGPVCLAGLQQEYPGRQKNRSTSTYLSACLRLARYFGAGLLTTQRRLSVTWTRFIVLLPHGEARLR
jgi:hypothetical protein